MNKEFYEDARKVAESCSKERLVELYLAEVQTCCELEEMQKENQQLKQQLAESNEENKKLVKALNGDIFINYKVPMENAKLKQQLHDIPKKIIRDVVDELGDCGKIYLEDEPYIEICIVKGVLQAILKKYGDKNESNND